MALKRLTAAAFLTVLALAFAYLEHLIPIQALIPVPGLKLGLANMAAMFCLLAIGWRYAMLLTVVRCLLQGLLFGTGISLLFSVFGGIAAVCIMGALCHWYPRLVTEIGIGIAGAAVHNVVQVFCAVLLYHVWGILTYLPILLAISLVTGTLTGYLCHTALVRIPGRYWEKTT